MNNRFLDQLKRKKYVCVAIIFTMLNIGLGAVLIRTSSAHTKDFRDQKPVIAEVATQTNSPLLISVSYIDDSQLSFQSIVYSLQNVSNKPIRAYTLIGDGKNIGQSVTNYFSTELLEPGQNTSNELFLERELIKAEEIISLSIDYVEFADGSSWGNDNQRKSNEIAGEREGVKAAIKQLKILISEQKADNVNDITSILNQDIKEFNVAVPSINQSDEWKRGFRAGYKSVISVLQITKRQGNENFLSKLDEMEKTTN